MTSASISWGLTTETCEVSKKIQAWVIDIGWDLAGLEKLSCGRKKKRLTTCMIA